MELDETMRHRLLLLRRAARSAGSPLAALDDVVTDYLAPLLMRVWWNARLDDALRAQRDCRLRAGRP
jgi:hypothetical protein